MFACASLGLAFVLIALVVVAAIVAVFKHLNKGEK